MKKEIIKKEKYKKGVTILKSEIINHLEISENDPELLEAVRYNDDSESYTIKITLSRLEIDNYLKTKK